MSSVNSLTTETRNTLELWTKFRVNQCTQLENGQKYIFNLLDLLEKIHFKWRQTSVDNVQLLELNDRQKRQIVNFEEALSESNETFRKVNSELAASQAENQALKEELAMYKQLFDTAKTHIQNATLVLPHPIREVPIETDAIMECRNGKRRSNSLGILPDKRIKRLEDNLERLCEEEYDDDEPKVAVAPLRMRTMNRSMSESHIFEDKKEMVAQQLQQPMSAKCTTTSTLDIHLSPLCFASGWTKGRPIEQCGHHFVSHNNLFSVAFSYCCVCARSLGIRSLKCNDCKLQLHENCRQNAPIPCVPMVPTPQRNNAKQRPRLADLCPDSQPKIPGQIIRCVVALERGFISTVGLYRVPGCDSEVKKLKENFSSKYIPKLDQLDPETITGFIKKFLRDLREPLIPFSSFKEFYNAVINNDEAQLKTAIETLPIPNRDTLAFLCAHWQKVAMRSNENQMPLENLAKVLGPTVVGTASKLTHLQLPGNGASQSGGASCHYMEARKQVEILLCLLKLDHDYWISFYNYLPTQQQAQGPYGSNTPGTPQCQTLNRRQHPLIPHEGR